MSRPYNWKSVRLSRIIAILSVALGIVFFWIGRAFGLPFWGNFIFAIGIIVANVPEGLLPAVTLALAMASQRMARRNALIRHLPAVEALGATTVICTDKTGTLTQNRMGAKELHLGEKMSSHDPLYLRATTACLVTIVAMQVANLFICRTERSSSFRRYPRNALIALGLAVEIALIMLVVYTPWGQQLFGTSSLPLAVWLFAIPWAIAMVFAEELRKRFTPPLVGNVRGPNLYARSVPEISSRG